MIKSLTVLIALTFMVSCKDSQKPSYSIKKDVSKTQIHPGKKLMETNCYVCHSLTAPEDSRIAPPMIAIKKRYSIDNNTKEAFINSMQNWIKNPTEDNAIMYGAVKRFGLMPKQGFPEESIKQIADYMFEFEIDKPVWFEKHYKEQHGNGKGKGMGMKNKNQ
jgi:cytochrome c1